MRMIRRNSAKCGATIIEFALITVILMIVIFAGIEFDRMVLVYTTLANSARVGVRYAIVHGEDRTGTGDPASGRTDSSAVVTVVKNFASAGMLNTSALSVTVSYPASTSSTDPGNTRGSVVAVSVAYPYDPFIVLPLQVTLRSATQGIIVF
jgi:Flp pilus assembly protein TadG